MPILKGVSLEIYPGDTVAITGRSGQGKSTLLQILGTLEPSCSGTLEIASKPVSIRTKNTIRNRHIAFIFQSFHLLEDYTALENILMPVRIARESTREGSPAHQRAWMLLEQMNMAHRAHFQAKYLSGGEKQRIAIARAFIHNPDIIFADEPSGNLDKENAQLTHRLLIDFAVNQNKGLLVVTHDPELAAMCGHSYEIYDGCLCSRREASL